MIRATTSWLLLIPAFLSFIIVACIGDVMSKLFSVLGKERMSRHCLVEVSKFIEWLMKLWGTRIEVMTPATKLDPHRPVLLVASHHSSLDINLLINHLSPMIGNRKLHFVSRGGLDRWIPAISFFARQYCYCLIGKAGRLVPGTTSFTTDELELPVFAKRVDTRGDALVIFPEGIKPHNGIECCRTFRRKGLRMLLENMPNVQIVPIGIAGTGSFYTAPRCLKSLLTSAPKYNCRLKIQVLPALQYVQSDCNEHIIDLLEAQISASHDSLLSRNDTRGGLISLSRRWTL